MRNNTKHKWLLPLGSAFVAAVIAAGAWFGVDALRTDTPEVDDIYVVSLSMDVYPTIEDLSDASDVVVLGTVKSIAGSGVSRGQDGTGGAYPYNLYELDVTEVFKGQVSETLYVYRTDPSLFGEAPGLTEYPLTTLSVGETVVLYLERVSTDYEPTIPSTLGDTIYVPLSFDNGVFDVTASGPIGAVGTVDDNTEVRPRGVRPWMFAEGTVFTAADIREAFEPDSDEEGPVGNTN